MAHLFCKYISILWKQPLVNYSPFMLCLLEMWIWIQKEHFLELKHHSEVNNYAVTPSDNSVLLNRAHCHHTRCRLGTVNSFHSRCGGQLWITNKQSWTMEKSRKNWETWGIYTKHVQTTHQQKVLQGPHQPYLVACLKCTAVRCMVRVGYVFTPLQYYLSLVKEVGQVFHSIGP